VGQAGAGTQGRSGHDDLSKFLLGGAFGLGRGCVGIDAVHALGGQCHGDGHEFGVLAGNDLVRVAQGGIVKGGKCGKRGRSILRMFRA
jgi:hypothetical protein